MLNEIVSLLNEKVPGASASLHEAQVGDSWIKVNPESIWDVAHTLKTSEHLFKTLQVISGVDYPEKIEVNYMIASFEKNLEIILKTDLVKESAESVPTIQTVCDIWKAANWQERECADMVGVKFLGHPDPRRILCPDDWEGYPLRKDYIVQEEYQGMKVNPVEKMNNPDREFAARQKEMERALKGEA